MSMKIAVILCFAFAAYTSAAPASSSSETELIYPGYGNQPIVDTGVVGASSGGGFFDSSFDIFQGMESMMRRMREQMNALLNRFGPGVGNQTSITEDFAGFGFPNIDGLDLGKGNTTSVTKVINGQKVVINETKYSKENPNGGAFFKVRVIEVKPEKPETPSTTLPRDVESVENSQENEIPKKADTEAFYGKLEPLDDTDYTLPSHKIIPTFNRWNNLEAFDDENRIDGPLARPVAPFDLSNDIYVNKLLADRRYPINPDSEFIGSHNKIETFDKRPNLKRDIWVNQLMADQAVAHNPDAEILQNKRAFEKYINPR